MSKIATPDYPIQDVISKRWSPYSFGPKPVAQEDLRALFEAARWAASSYNEQPWRFIVATADDKALFARVLSCLVEPNQAWAKHAPVLALGAIRKKFARNGSPNKAAEHDLGLAVGNLCVEATARGLHVHQMIGLEHDKANKEFSLPEDATVHTAFTIGYAGEAPLPDDVLARDEGERQRIPAAELVFGGDWETPSSIYVE